MIDTGEPAPNFELPDGNGQIHRLEDYAGQWVVLYFYPWDDTPGCVAEGCAFRDEYSLLKHQNTQVLGVSMNTMKSHEAFAEKYQLPFPILSDPDGDVVDQYGAMGGFPGFRFAKRHTFLIDPDGIIQHLWRNVAAKEHAHEISGLLNTLQSAP